MSVASSQGSLPVDEIIKPFTKSPFNTTNVIMNSSLNMGNKHDKMPPTNYFGIRSFRPPANNTRAFRPAPIEGVYKFKGPVQHTTPVQQKFQ